VTSATRAAHGLVVAEGKPAEAGWDRGQSSLKAHSAAPMAAVEPVCLPVCLRACGPAPACMVSLLAHVGPGGPDASGGAQSLNTRMQEFDEQAACAYVATMVCA
jgi:hypothetical protein